MFFVCLHFKIISVLQYAKRTIRILFEFGFAEPYFAGFLN